MKNFIYIFIFNLILFTGCDKISNPLPQNYIYPNKFYLPDIYLKKLNFKNKNILEIQIEDKWYYVKPNGEAILALSDKNHADRFVEGLARTVLDGKMGYFNRNLEVVIKPMYDYAYPFHDGVAQVCIGCDAKEIDKKIVNGGNWKKIDRNGLIID